MVQSDLLQMFCFYRTFNTWSKSGIFAWKSIFTLYYWYFYLRIFLHHCAVLLLIQILIHIFLKGMSISWQQIGGTRGSDSSRYIGQPGSCFTPSGTARHRGSVNIAGKTGSCSTKKVNSRPTYCSSSSIIYIKRCLQSLHSHCSSL